jgi:hypothetical protein
MTASLILAAVVVTVMAAVRSTWSPCGLSMLASITPLSEAGRGHRYRTTATWFVVGSTVGGAMLGLLVAGLARAVAALSLTPGQAILIALGATAVAFASDLNLGGFHLPVHHRQVNERWLDQFRPWVYGAGFGWQIGTGLATYIMTAGVYLLIALAALTGRPWLGLVCGLLFGVTRGLSVLLGRHITSTATLRSFHARFYGLGATARRGTLAVEVLAATLFVWLLAPWAGLVVLVASGLGVAVGRARRGGGLHAKVAPVPVPERSRVRSGQE